MDPVPGGNANAYVYALDPINFSDLSGMLSVAYNYGMQGGVGASVLQPTAEVAVYQPSINSSRMQGSYAETLRIRAVITSTRALSPAIAAVQHAVVVAAPGATAVAHASVGDAPEIEGRTMAGFFKTLGKGCVVSAGGLLAVGGSLTLLSGRAFALPSAGVVGSACVVGGFTTGLEYLLFGDDYPNNAVYDVSEGLREVYY